MGPTRSSPSRTYIETHHAGMCRERKSSSAAKEEGMKKMGATGKLVLLPTLGGQTALSNT